ncbi:hypothetical protein QUC31_015157 [Theobroma cacao]|uniref:Uncharacterized protein n=1 Tax=Theobroma cacao TaxID=3641 RepID=A0A061E261_THECC|nr:Uncharacterized protein TCM_007202 [Theobroma cacao]
MSRIVVSDVHFLFMLLERREGKSRLTLLDTFGDLSASALLLRVKVLEREKFIVLEGLLFRLELFDQKVGLGEPVRRSFYLNSLKIEYDKELFRFRIGQPILQMLEVIGIGDCHIPGRYPSLFSRSSNRACTPHPYVSKLEFRFLVK